MKDSFKKTLIGMLAGIACMTASCAEFIGELYQAEWFSKTDCGFWMARKAKWDGGERGFDEYMEVDGVKYPERSYSAAWKDFLLIPVRLDKPGEKFTPVVVNGTTSGEVGISVLTDEQVCSQFRNSQKSWAGYWLNEVFPNGKTSGRRAWIKVMPGQSKTTLKANVDLSKRPAAGIYSDRSMSALAAEYGVNYFTGVYPVAPSTWYAIGIKETGEIFVPTESGLDSPRLYVSQLESSKEFFKTFSPYVDDMEEMMGEDRCEAIVCPAAWYVSAKDAGGAELVVWSENVRKGTVSGNGIYKLGTKVSLKATANKDYVFAGWYDKDGVNPLAGDADYRNATYAYVTTDKNVMITAKFATKLEDVDSLQMNLTNVAASAIGELSVNLSDTNLVSSLSLPKLTVSGLPDGLKYDATTMKIAGKATKPGVYKVTMKATNASVTKAREAQFEITVPNLVPGLFKEAGYAADGVYELDAGAAPDLSGVIQAVKGEGWKIAVAGLPAGLKYDDKNGAVTGVATKEGTYTVTFTVTKGREKEIATATFKVAFPTLTIEMAALNDSGATDGAKVVGGGKYPVGAKVSLKATPGKDGVFTGWYDAGGNPLAGGADYRNATYAYVATDADVTLVAKFVTAEEDRGSIRLSLGGELSKPSVSEPVSLATNVTCGVALGWQLEASAFSATTVKVAGLPSGLKFTDKPVTSKVGTGASAITVTNVLANTIYGAPTAASAIDGKTGLPKPSEVKITVTTAGKSSVVYLVRLTVDPLPAWAVGSFEGSAGEGSATMSVTAAGKVAGKFSFGGTTWTFKADSYAAVESLGATTNLSVSAVATAGKATMPVELSLSDLALGYLPASAASCAVGTFGDANAEMYRLVWSDKGDADAASRAAGYAGAYSLVAAYGDLYGGVTFTLNEKGAVSGAAVLPDGAKTRKVTFAANALAEPDGLHVVVALPPDAKKGYPAVFEDRVLIPWSGVADDDHAYRDPGAIVGTGELNLGSGASGTVTVSPKYGQVAAGKTVTLTAKADKGSVFSCWEIDGVDTAGLDLSSATLKYVSPASGDVTATAKFVTVEEDIASLTLALPDAAAASDGTCDVDLGACVESLSIPKLTVSGLPAGLKYDAKTMKITGKVTKPGVYTVTVKATNTSATGKDAKTATLKITVPNFECEALPNLDPATNAYGILTAGVAISADLVDCTPADGWTVKVAGLPAGLKYDTKTGKITGTPTAKAGSYTVTFTASKKGEPNQMATITLNVEPLPDWVVGTFNGGSDVWQSIITVGANGKISGKYLQTFNYTFTFTSPGFDKVEYVSEDVDPEWNGWKYSAVVTAKSSAIMERYTLEIYNGALGGKARLLDNVDYTGPYLLTSAYLFQAVDWKSEPWKSFAAAFGKDQVEYKFDDRNGNPVVLELKFSATGAVTVKGSYYVWDSKTGTYVKQSATGSATLIPTAYSPGDNAFRARVYVVLPKALTGGCGKCVKLIWDGAAGAWSVDLQT